MCRGEEEFGPLRFEATVEVVCAELERVARGLSRMLASQCIDLVVEVGGERHWTDGGGCFVVCWGGGVREGSAARRAAANRGTDVATQPAAVRSAERDKGARLDKAETCAMKSLTGILGSVAG